MRTDMRRTLVLSAIVMMCARMWGVDNSKNPTITRFYADKKTQTIRVTVQNKTGDLDTLEDAAKWDVTLYNKDGTRTNLQGSAAADCPSESVSSSCWSVSTVGSTVPPKKQFPANARQAIRVSTSSSVVLTLPQDKLSDAVVSIAVAFDNRAFVQAPETPTCGGFLCVAQSKSDSALYLSGLYSPAFNSQAQYTIDAEGLLTFPNQSKTARFGGTFNVSTDNRPSADPNSFVVSGLFQWTVKSWTAESENQAGPKSKNQALRVQGVLLQWNFTGLEFDRQTTTKTIISTPAAEMPMNLFSNRLALTPYAGIDFGSNLSNAINPNGSGLVFRGLAGNSLDTRWKTPWKNLSQLEVTANYTVRLPATDEVFTNLHYISATGKTVSIPTYSTQARHHLTDELDITLQKPIVLTIKHEYGELPPGFRKVDNKISIGITLMFSHGTGPDHVTEATW